MRNESSVLLIQKVEVIALYKEFVIFLQPLIEEHHATRLASTIASTVIKLVCELTCFIIEL